VLEPVVQDMDGAAEATLRERSGQIPVGTDHHRTSWQLPRKHQRLVPRDVVPRGDSDTVADHDGAVSWTGTRITTAQNGRFMPDVLQQSRYVRNER
jgi:hypothetical protein